MVAKCTIRINLYIVWSITGPIFQLIYFIVSTVSGLSGDTATAQSQVSVGMGLLSGSTVMLITVIWGTCVVVGKCDMQNSITADGKDTKRFNLTGMFRLEIISFSFHPYVMHKHIAITSNETVFN